MIDVKKLTDYPFNPGGLNLRARRYEALTRTPLLNQIKEVFLESLLRYFIGSIYFFQLAMKSRDRGSKKFFRRKAWALFKSAPACAYKNCESYWNFKHSLLHAIHYFN